MQDLSQTAVESSSLGRSVHCCCELASSELHSSPNPGPFPSLSHKMPHEEMLACQPLPTQCIASHKVLTLSDQRLERGAADHARAATQEPAREAAERTSHFQGRFGMCRQLLTQPLLCCLYRIGRFTWATLRNCERRVPVCKLRGLVLSHVSAFCSPPHGSLTPCLPADPEAASSWCPAVLSDPALLRVGGRNRGRGDTLTPKPSSAKS